MSLGSEHDSKVYERTLNSWICNRIANIFLIEGAKKVRARDCKPMEITPDYQYQNFT
jgi:hypothetical protein